MSVSIENAQKITDLRRRMYENIQQGKPSHEGLNESEYREALDAIRSSRAQAAAASAPKTRAKKAKEPSAPKVTREGSALSKLAKFNLD